MADILDNGEFWLPSHFLTDDDKLLGKENLDKNGANPDFGPGLCFPAEFPYGFDSFGSSALNSPVESVVSSTETESDEEDLLAGLARQLARSAIQETQKLAAAPEKTWILSGSPQSTLSGLGSWSGCSGSPNGPSQVSSPPTTPLGINNDAWDVIYAAAGQVARLKMGVEGPKYHHRYHQNGGLLGVPVNTSRVPGPPVKKPSSGFYSDHSMGRNMPQTNQLQNLRQDHLVKQPQQTSVWGRQAKEGWLSQQQQQIQNRGKLVGHENGRCGRPLGLPQSAWPPLQLQQQQQRNGNGSGMRAVFLGGSGVKRESTGTGVFLPRRYGNPSESRKKSGCSTALLPARVVQALNLSFEDTNTLPQPRFSNASPLDYGALMARRNALFVEQQKRMRPEAPNNGEIRLPQEWTY
ncbi:uncharacterized protein LOC131167042 [Malania oleifera]|uniref:uncharacterized protein LOC131167042 n=1 Tax=Malania oleifera TaxID=397392 RepID=UPI0025ADFE3F|nr:uncharacterized protein LOC131167042 [Malania oleifera]